MPQGNIKKLVSDRGFGFISLDGKELFFHRSNVKDDAFEQLREGDQVEFTESSGPKGPCAVDVTPG